MPYSQRKQGRFAIQSNYEILLLDVPRDESGSGGGINSHQTKK